MPCSPALPRAPPPIMPPAALAAPHNARGSFPSSRFVAPTHCTPQHMPRTNAAARSARASPIPVSKSGRTRMCCQRLESCTPPAAGTARHFQSGSARVERQADGARSGRRPAGHAHLPPRAQLRAKHSPATQARGAEEFLPLSFNVTVLERSTVAEMARMPKVRVGRTCGLHRCICKTQTLRSSYCSLASRKFHVATLVKRKGSSISTPTQG